MNVDQPPTAWFVWSNKGHKPEVFIQLFKLWIISFAVYIAIEHWLTHRIGDSKTGTKFVHKRR